MRTIFFLVRKEFRQIFRDPVLVFQLLAVPFIQVILITSAATFDVRDVPTYLIDRDGSPASRQLVDEFQASGRFAVRRAGHSSAEAGRALAGGEVAAIVTIPDGFGRDLGTGRPGRVQLVFDGVDGPTAGTASSYAREIIRGFGERFGREIAPAEAGGATAGPEAAVQIDIHHRSWYNPERAYGPYMVAGILVLVVTIVGTLMTALNIVREKERGTIEQLNVTPITKGQFITGKLTPFWMLGLGELGFGLVLGRAIFDLPFEGSLLLVFLGGAIYLVAALAMGLLISTTTDTQQQALFIVFFILVIYLFLSGLFTPVSSMPEWAQWLAEINPIKHLITLVRAVLLKGAGAAAVASELLILTGMSVLALPLAVRLYSKTAS